MNYIKLFFTLSILYLYSFSCKEQNKEHNKSLNSNNLIDTKLSIDKKYTSDDKFKSTSLNSLFNGNDYSYIIGEYSGTSKKNFHCNIVGLFKNNSFKNSYVLFLDNNDILRDTLNIKSKDISLDVVFENNKKGIALGNMNINEIKNSYFHITDLYELDDKKIKLKKIDLNTEILKCEVPIQYLTEEYVGIEYYFEFGVAKSFVSKNNNQNSNKNPNLKETSWAINCSTSERSITFEDEKKMVISMEFNQYYITLQEKSRKGNVISYQYSEMSGLGSVDYNSKSYDNTETVCTLEIIDENTLKFNWLGFYDKELKKRFHSKNPLDETKKMVDIIKCE